MNKLVKAIIDIYGQVGDFHITPFDGAIPVSEADEQAEKVVKVYTDALLVGACAENERLREALQDLLHAVCGEKGFAEAVRRDSGRVYPWPALDLAEVKAIAALGQNR